MRRIGRWISSLGICAITGAIVGTVSGFIFELLQLAPHLPRISATEAACIGLALGVFGWVVVLVFVGLMAGYGVRPILLSSLVTALLTGIATAVVDNAIRLPLISVFVGFVIGLLIGALLCRMCRLRTRPLRDERRYA